MLRVKSKWHVKVVHKFNDLLHILQFQNTIFQKQKCKMSWTVTLLLGKTAKIIKHSFWNMNIRDTTRPSYFTRLRKNKDIYLENIWLGWINTKFYIPLKYTWSCLFEILSSLKLTHQHQIWGEENAIRNCTILHYYLARCKYIYSHTVFHIFQ